ncbi:MAG TPA: two-component regulator propeller domain-containing protein [Gillisia sp.]|nr:two-component regulator propeller domain-containing protein [Gillisia sp.]
MPYYKIIKLFLIFFLWVNVVFSQNYPSKNYTAADELPNNAIRSLLVDSNNILWIGTENGVVKKENDVFTNFFEEDGLALNSCWAIAEDKNKKLWFGSYGEGVSIYDGVKFKVISEKEGLVHNEITKLFSFENYMFVGTSDGVSIIDVNTFKVISLNKHSNNELFRVQDFFEYKNQIYVVTYNSGIFKILNKNDRKTLVKVNNHEYIYSILVDNDSIFSSNKEYFTKSKIGEYVNEKDSIPLKKLGHSIIWDYVKTGDHKIFAAAWGIYDSNGGIYEVVGNQLISRASDFNVLSRKVISLTYDATFEKLYIGTKDAGLFEINLNPQIKFNGIQGKNVIGFAKTNKISAVLLNDAIILKSAENERTINLPQLKKWQEKYVLNTKLPLPKHQDSFYELDYTMLVKNIRFYDIKVSHNIFWVNTNIGLFAIKDSGELLRYLPLHSEEINFTEAGNLIETNHYGGVRMYSDLDNFKYTHFKQEDSQTPTMVVNSLQQGNKTYFLSVFSGLFVWKNNGFKSYLQNGIWEEKKLKHLTALGKNMAISNEFGDVFIVNDASSFKLLKKIPRAKIQGNSISFLKEYKGTLLIATEKGLTLFKNNRFIFLDEEQGLKQPMLSAEVNKNLLSVGSNNGYYNINLEVVSNSKALVNQLKLKEIFINNNKFPLGQFANKEKINLAHNENTILLKFSTNAHPYPYKLSYRYRLNANESWSIPFSKPEIFLPYLPANNYKVEVKVMDQSTGLSYTQSLLKLSILPPFWLTWWFVLLIMSAIFMVVYSIYKFQIRHKKEKIREIYNTETRISKVIHDELANDVYNVMSGLEAIAPAETMDKLEHIYSRTRNISRENMEIDTGPGYLDHLTALLSAICPEDARLIISGKTISLNDLNPEKKFVVYRVLQEIMVNMKKHSRASLVALVFTEEKKYLKIDYSDSGEGVTRQAIKNGNGLKNVENRIFSVNGKLTFENEKGKGLKIMVLIPI